jgi:hypothetical protein
MGIQDRDYYHDRDRYHAGVTDRRDYSQRLRDMEAAGQTINIEVDKPRRRFRIMDGVRNRSTPVDARTDSSSSGDYSVACLLIAAVVGMLAFLGYRVINAVF